LDQRSRHGDPAGRRARRGAAHCIGAAQRLSGLSLLALDGFGSFCEWIFGACVLMFLLVFLAVIPILQFLSLGYLLEVTGRLARTGKRPGRSTAEMSRGSSCPPN